jgi:small subunit ribosomal protein S8
MTDIIADMLTRVRNAQRAGHSSVLVPHSALKKGILQVMMDEGYIKSYEDTVPEPGVHKQLVVHLKYVKKDPVIKEITRVSKPGCRIYSSIKALRSYYNNFGVVILSTSRGIMSDATARKMNVGGEVICKIF